MGGAQIDERTGGGWKADEQTGGKRASTLGKGADGGG